MESRELNLRLLTEENTEVRHFERLATLWAAATWLASAVVIAPLILAASHAFRETTPAPGRASLISAAVIIGVITAVGDLMIARCRARVLYHHARMMVHWNAMEFDAQLHQLGEVNREHTIDTTRYTRTLQLALSPLAILAIVLAVLAVVV